MGPYRSSPVAGTVHLARTLQHDTSQETTAFTFVQCDTLASRLSRHCGAWSSRVGAFGIGPGTSVERVDFLPDQPELRIRAGCPPGSLSGVCGLSVFSRRGFAIRAGFRVRSFLSPCARNALVSCGALSSTRSPHMHRLAAGSRWKKFLANDCASG